MDNSANQTPMQTTDAPAVMPENPDISPFINASPDSSTNTPTATGTSDNQNGDTPPTNRRRQVIMLGIALILMIVGVASGTILLNRQSSFEQSFGWDCSLYKFNVDETGSVTVQNGSSRNLPAQVATVYVDDVQVAEFDVPALDSGAAKSLGVVPVPEDGKFSWRVLGNKECDQTGGVAASAKAECTNIKAFDEDWNLLTAEDLTKLKSGDMVRFSVAGSTNKGTFKGARFTINGDLRDAVTSIRPGTDEFYDEYELPVGIKTFNIGVELEHSDAGWF